MVVVLGWGSLCWQPGSLASILAGEWREDGPQLPVEFCRQSNDGRLTLVITEGAQAVPVLWSKTKTRNVDLAMEELRVREKCPPSKIGRLRQRVDAEVLGIRAWLDGVGADSVIWTNLSPKFGGINVAPTSSQAIDYLKSLKGSMRDKAEEYVRKAPIQISTDYRSRFETELGWNP